MTTQCSTDRLRFQPLGRREVVGAFDGGTITSMDSGDTCQLWRDREIRKNRGMVGTGVGGVATWQCRPAVLNAATCFRAGYSAIFS